MSVLSRIDGHCHLFNVYYLLKEIATIACDPSYRISKEFKDWLYKKNTADRTYADDTAGLCSLLLDWVFDIWQALFRSEACHYRLIVQAAEAGDGWVYKTNIVYPLMMDIYYMASAPCPDTTELKSAGGKRDLKICREELDGILGKINAKFESCDKSIKKPLEPHMRSFLKQMKRYPQKRNGVMRRNQAAAAADPFYSWGFWDHLTALWWLHFWNKGKVYPFFAVDPRRPGVMQMVRKYVSPKGPFYGIKLYTYLGYTPDCPGLQDLYPYCTERDLPIVVHCNKEGFPPDPDWPYIEYANPEKWKTILVRYPTLRIDFAHMGMNVNPARGSWTDTILAYINSGAYPNVYTDIACFSSEEEISNFLELWNKPENARLKERVMFGTDYVVMLLSGLLETPPVPTDLHGYFKRFKNLVDPGILRQIAEVNPRQFMNI